MVNPPMRMQMCGRASGAINRILRLKLSLLTKFSLISFLLTATIAVGLAWGIQQQMEKSALLQEAESASDQVANILNPNLRLADLAGPLDPIRYVQIDTLIQQNLIREHIVRVKIWSLDGLLIYSDDKDLVGNRFPMNEELKEALAGKMAMEISSLEKEENIGERGNFSRLLEVYVPLQPIDSPQIAGAYEIYHSMAVLEPRIAEIYRFVWGSISLGFLILYVSLFTLVRNASKELIRRNEENVRLYEEAKKQLAERIRAEKEATRLATFPELNPSPIIEVDIAGHVHYINPAAKRLFPDLQTTGFQHPFFAGLETVITTFQNKDKTSLISEIKIGDIWYEYAYYYDVESRRIRIYALDITEHKLAKQIQIVNERLVYASRAKSEFLASMSHELRTPLNSIMGFTELLKLKASGEMSKKQEHYIDNILTSSRFLLDLINDILDLSKVEAGKIELSIENISVPEILNEIIILIKERATKHNVAIKKEFDPQLEIEADRQRFKQILFNLLSNAIKFSKEEGGTVTITAKKEGDMARISVADTGIGIREEDMGKLFNEFEQANPGISRKYGGTGLGLAISKKLVELQGGKIWAESKYGKGSTFSFLISLAAKKEANK